MPSLTVLLQIQKKTKEDNAMFVGNLKQWEKELAYVPTAAKAWVQYVGNLDLDSLTPGRHDLDKGCYFNVDVVTTAAADTRNMEAHEQYIDIQVLLDGHEQIGYQPVTQIGPVISHEEGSDNWFYRPDTTKDLIIPMVPRETYAIFTPADGHRCLCAPNGAGETIKKVILKVKV